VTASAGSASGESGTRADDAPAFVVRRLGPADAVAYRATMLDAYEREPAAFTSTRREREALPLAWWERRLAAGPDASEVVLGAFERAMPAGVVGLSFEAREKSHHKATLFGMYVVPHARQRGLGHLLVNAALDHARSRTGVRIVQLTVSQGNERARLLYERCGFIAFGVEPFAVAIGSTFLSKIHMWISLAV